MDRATQNLYFPNLTVKPRVVLCRQLSLTNVLLASAKKCGKMGYVTPEMVRFSGSSAEIAASGSAKQLIKQLNPPEKWQPRFYVLQPAYFLIAKSASPRQRGRNGASSIPPFAL